MTLKQYAKKKGIPLRDAYRLMEEGKITVVRRLEPIQSIRNMWVYVVVDEK